MVQLRTALAWQEAGVDLAEVDDFVAWGIRPADVEAGAAHGLDPATVLAWGPVMRDVGAHSAAR